MTSTRLDFQIYDVITFSISNDDIAEKISRFNHIHPRLIKRKYGICRRTNRFRYSTLLAIIRVSNGGLKGLKGTKGRNTV